MHFRYGFFRWLLLSGLLVLALPAQSADHVLEAIVREGGRAAAMEADLRDEATVPKLFDFAERELGPVDILVNNATGWVGDT